MSPRPNRGEERRPGARARAHGEARQAAGRSGWPSRGYAAGACPAARVAELLGSGWEGKSYLALDFETTGLDPRGCRVVEVGALRFSPARTGKDGREGRLVFRIEGAFSSLVNPGMPIPPEVIAIHGIHDRDVERSPSFREIAPALMALASGARIIAHNAPFDLSFLRAELARSGMPEPANDVLDTRILAKRAFPDLTSYSLVNLASRFCIDAGRSHRALDDARSCMELMLLCVEEAFPKAEPEPAGVGRA